ncbi:MAG: ATP-binding protein, partial [Saccharothrix sp.]|nr:ATP-binding protein [Saccharothrix sp.]
MAVLSEGGARVVLVATSGSEVLGRTVRDLAAVLVQRCGVPAERLGVVVGPADARAVAEAVAEEARRAESALLVYVVGRCVVGPDGEWFLVVNGAAGDEVLPFSELRDAARSGSAGSVAVVLDCSTDTPDAVPPRADGVYVIAAGVPAADPDARHTALGGALIDLLVHGDPLGPRLLTLDAVHDALSRALPASRLSPRTGAPDLVIGPNPAARAPSPHVGPLPFGVDDAGRFHGRERMVDLLARAVARPGALVLVGPAGSGKTSLLHAGLLARLRGGDLPDVPSDLPCRVITPGADPLESLAPGAADLLRRQPGRVAEVLGERSAVLVDQAEELFTLCRDPAERTAFVRALTAARDAGTLVVLALRADFYGHAAALPELSSALRDNQVLVEPMTPDELRAAIEDPAAALEDGLADLVLADLDAVGTASLVPLSHALWTTWLHREGTRLTIAGYRRGGGVAHSVATWAEHVHARLSPAEQEAVRRVLPRLVTLGDGTPDTAATADLTTLTDGLPDVPAARRAI